MKRVGKKEIGFGIFSILAGRVLFYGANPFAVGLYGAMCMEQLPKGFCGLGLLLGMFSVMPKIDWIIYFIIITGMGWILEKIEKKNCRISSAFTGVVAAVVFMGVLWLKEPVLSIVMKKQWSLLLAEGVVVFTTAMVFRPGIHRILQSGIGKKWDEPLNNEEMISLLLLCFLGVCGIPNITMKGVPFLESMSFMETGIYFLILIFSYLYGSGAGAIAGTFAGVLLWMNGEKMEYMGLFPILGIGVGIFRELGSLVTGAFFVITYIAFGYFGARDLWDVGKVRGLAAAVTIFLCIPSKFKKKIDLENIMENNYGRQSLQQVTKEKLTGFANAFQRLSRTFYSLADTKEQFDQKDMDGVLLEVTKRLCSNCEKSNRCLGYTRHEKYQTAKAMLGAVKNNGYVLATDLPKDFMNKCDYPEIYIEEANRELEYAKLNLNWYNRMAENREAIADQLGEVAHIIHNFSNEIYHTKSLPMELEEQLIEELKRNHVVVKKIALIERNNKHREIYVTLKCKGKRCIPTRQIGQIISSTCKKNFKSSHSNGYVVGTQYQEMVFIEDSNFKVLTGIAREAKEGEEVCGDNYSFIQLETGEMIMSLSDGMGSGMLACEESESVIELLEDFIEAGFKEESAIKLINSILVLRSNEQSFSTVDMAVINLFTGICDFIKIGAATTFLKRDNWVETIRSTTMPIGVFNQVDYDNISKKLYEGDHIIMVSDGVLDSAPGEEKEKFFEELLCNISSQNPNEIAAILLEKAKENNQNQVIDDMTVLVAGIWKK